jgi:hypothetical protein
METVKNAYHDLHLDALAANIIKDKFGARGSLVVYPPCSLYLYILAVLARLEVGILSNKICKIGVHMKFMRVW